jgi:hypothetical protein
MEFEMDLTDHCESLRDARLLEQLMVVYILLATIPCSMVRVQRKCNTVNRKTTYNKSAMQLYKDHYPIHVLYIYRTTN